MEALSHRHPRSSRLQRLTLAGKTGVWAALLWAVLPLLDGTEAPVRVPLFVAVGLAAVALSAVSLHFLAWAAGLSRDDCEARIGLDDGVLR